MLLAISNYLNMMSESIQNRSKEFEMCIRDSVDADTVNDATAFLETFFKLYPTATEKELAYYVAGNVLEPCLLYTSSSVKSADRPRNR